MVTLEAQLETAWKHLDAGNVKAARAAAQAALAAAPDAPEPHTLLGALASVEGEPQAALASFDKAMALDPDYFEPIFLAAQLQAAEGALEEALVLCKRGLDCAEEEEEFLDMLLLKAELELGIEDPDAAAETLAELPPVDLPEAGFHIRAGGCLLELALHYADRRGRGPGRLDQIDKAEKHFASAAKLDPTLADAHHGLGLVAEARGDEKAKIAHFQTVRTLDLKEPTPPWSVTSERLEERVEAALAELPARARKLLENVPVVVEDYPSATLVGDGVDPRLLGLFSGVPYPEQSTLSGQPPHLECVMLFKRNLERDARTSEEVEQEIRVTLLHETGHFFGMDEEDLEEVGLE